MKNTNLHSRVGKSLDLPQASHHSAVPYASTPGFEDDLHAGHGWIRSGPEIDPAAALSADLMVTNTLTTLSTVIGDDGNNTLPGTGDDDTMYGLGGNDTLLGYDGDDTLIGGAGDDVLVGDRGLDVAAYTEPMAGYVFSNPDSKVFRVTDTILANGDDGADTLSGIETVRFSGGDIQVAQVGEFRVNTHTLGYQGDPVLAPLSCPRPAPS